MVTVPQGGYKKGEVIYVPTKYGKVSVAVPQNVKKGDVLEVPLNVNVHRPSPKTTQTSRNFTSVGGLYDPYGRTSRLLDAGRLASYAKKRFW